MQDLLYDLHSLLKRAPYSGAFSTQANRKAILLQMGRQLLDAGFKRLHAEDLKGRHVNTLLKLWAAEQISPATEKNRMSVLRWWARQIGKPDLIKPRNAAYGIPNRQPKALTSKARRLEPDALRQVRNRYVKMSLELQRVFGLRREEAIKIRPHQADHGAYLELQASWCKGGRPRRVPILTDAQREVLDRAKALARFKHASLIPKNKTYVAQLGAYEGQCRRAGLHKMHGLRHAYAEARFLELAGFAAPAAGGPSWKELSPLQKVIDEEARLVVSEELGHSRKEITVAYLGK